MSPAEATDGRCIVIGAEHLPSGTGGNEELCRTVQSEIAMRTPARNYRVEIRVLSASRLSAALTLNGRQLPEQRFAVMDGKLGRDAVQRFAKSLAGVIAQAAEE